MDTIPQDAPLKQCTKCQQWKLASPEYFHRRGKYGLKSVCKQCRAKPYKGDIIDGKKRCSMCKQWLPATPEFFDRAASIRSGWQSRCKKCRSNEYYRRFPERCRDNIPEGYKRCSRCEQFLPATLEYFYAKETGRLRLASHCKQCHSLRRKQNYQLSRPQELACMQEYRRTHRVEMREGKRKYKRSHPEETKAHTRNRRARLKSVPGIHTSEQIQEQLKRQRYRCYYAACGFSKFPRVKENGKWKYIFDVDHTFPVSRVAGTSIPANDMGYLVLSCHSCNQSKGDKFPWEWPEGGRLL